ncbi:MAG TPA: deoxyribodipyrimidine photo-lyase [Planctomycetota bacterium]|nr:deoxyribodipyrimidine photo-lyase [Planctomycetota bacterium]
MVEDERILLLNRRAETSGRYVLYWMQASQRTRFNHALEYAVGRANALNLPVVVGFGLTDAFPEANLRHYAFMLEGLREVARELESRGVRMVVRRGSPERVAVELARDAALVVTDRGYLRVQKKWRRHVARKTECQVVQVESDVVVPVETASTKAQYAAATLRPRITRHIDRFLRPLGTTPVRKDSLGMRLGGLDLSDLDAVLKPMRIDRQVGRVKCFAGGPSEARRRLDAFIRDGLDGYASDASDPSLDASSHLSAYLHFGQVSPVEIALRVKRAKARRESRERFLEQLIVRRELSMNFVHYEPRYDAYRSLPGWARTTLRRHANDRREHTYTRRQLEDARTHDPYWNAAMREMRLTGTMHNALRMYWGKKILEWSPSAEVAFRRTLHLNNRWFLDGRDPNSFAGVAWCFGKHDRPWGERAIFGTVRFMNARGLERKFDVDAYVRRIDALARSSAQEESP